MLTKAFRDLTLSCLGMGNMRLPTLPDGKVDRETTRKMLEYCYEHGVNYYDTAYSYHGGESEPVVGEILSQYPRESWYLASKMPGHELNPDFNPRAIFEEQLRRCKVDYFDFYLLHNVCELSIPIYNSEKFGIVDYLLEQKKLGKIRYLGFSTHASLENLREFLDRYDGIFDFAQIQLNYLDWTMQQGKEKYELLTERGLPIIVMEPVRGGKLANLSEQAAATLKSFRPDASIASWAFRWLQALPNVTVVLSGMSNPEQVADNIATYEAEAPLTEEERAALAAIAVEMLDLLPCTACRYCCKDCPQQLNIPDLLARYSEAKLGNANTVCMYIDALPEDKRPHACVQCGNCSRACPQNIDVPAALQKFAEILDGMTHWDVISRERAKLHAR